MSALRINPVDWFNFNGSFKEIFRHDQAAHLKSDTEACYLNVNDENDSINNPTFVLNPASGLVSVMKDNQFHLTKGDVVSKFMVLTAVKFKGDYNAAMSNILYHHMDAEVPYVRVGTTYFKVVNEPTRWGGVNTSLKPWNKDTITDDHTKNIFRLVPKYDSFIIHPDNRSHSRIVSGCYNHYAKFPHEPVDHKVTEKDIPNSITVLKHIFGDQLEQGIKYMKILYEHPRQMQQVLVLVSRERETGKTTFLDWIFMLFGDNSVLITPESLASEFNASYAVKNILVMEELMMEKAAGVERLKALTTGKMITVRQLYTPAYTIPFFGKVIICTNKVKEFMRIDKEENRFWIRYINPVKGKRNTKIDEALHAEIPLFLRFLLQQPAIDFSQGRFGLTAEETATTHLDDVKEESKSGLHKEIDLLVEQHFLNNDDDFFLATPLDIKESWFKGDHKVSRAYIAKVLKDEMRLMPEKQQWYYPFAQVQLGKSVNGRPYCFKRGKVEFQANSEIVTKDPELPL